MTVMEERRAAARTIYSVAGIEAAMNFLGHKHITQTIDYLGITARDLSRGGDLMKSYRRRLRSKATTVGHDALAAADADLKAVDPQQE
jgi:hypothetical protein